MPQRRKDRPPSRVTTVRHTREVTQEDYDLSPEIHSSPGARGNIVDNRHQDFEATQSTPGIKYGLDESDPVGSAPSTPSSDGDFGYGPPLGASSPRALDRTFTTDRPYTGALDETFTVSAPHDRTYTIDSSLDEAASEAVAQAPAPSRQSPPASSRQSAPGRIERAIPAPTRQASPAAYQEGPYAGPAGGAVRRGGPQYVPPVQQETRPDLVERYGQDKLKQMRQLAVPLPLKKRKAMPKVPQRQFNEPLGTNAVEPMMIAISRMLDHGIETFHERVARGRDMQNFIQNIQPEAEDARNRYQQFRNSLKNHKEKYLTNVYKHWSIMARQFEETLAMAEDRDEPLPILHGINYSQDISQEVLCDFLRNAVLTSNQLVRCCITDNIWLSKTIQMMDNALREMNNLSTFVPYIREYTNQQEVENRQMYNEIQESLGEVARFRSIWQQGGAQLSSPWRGPDITDIYMEERSPTALDSDFSWSSGYLPSTPGSSMSPNVSSGSSRNTSPGPSYAWSQ